MSTSQAFIPRDNLVGGKYRLRELIGSGGVGTVYRATHLWTEREVAVKILDPSLPHFEQLRDAFLREARASVQLDHPNVVDVLDMGEDGSGTTYMVMELLDGPTLRDVLLEQDRLSPSDAATILFPLNDALERAHELGIVHKDFKPENIILSIDASGVMTPKLLDFGVAQLVRETRPQRLMTSREVIIGTPQYMSPEQARDQRQLIGPQTDVWGVGVVWYECLTGRCPFDGDTSLDVLTAVCDAEIDFEGVPEEMVSVLRGALERSVSKRTPSLAALRADLERAGMADQTSMVEGRRTTSRAPQSERPSYVRRTLQGVGPSGPAVEKIRSVQLDSEILTLPSRSNRKAVIGGVALALAVAVAAWWTIREPQTDNRPVPTPTPSQQEPVVERAISNVVAEEEIEPAPAPESAEPAAEVQDAPPVEEEASAEAPPREPAPIEVVPSPAPIRPTARRAKPAGTPVRPEPSPRPEYEKPPELVTEW